LRRHSAPEDPCSRTPSALPRQARITFGLRFTSDRILWSVWNCSCRRGPCQASRARGGEGKYGRGTRMGNGREGRGASRVHTSRCTVRLARRPRTHPTRALRGAAVAGRNRNRPCTRHDHRGFSPAPTQRLAGRKPRRTLHTDPFQATCAKLAYLFGKKLSPGQAPPIRASGFPGRVQSSCVKELGRVTLQIRFRFWQPWAFRCEESLLRPLQQRPAPNPSETLRGLDPCAQGFWA
jgi:hypothetical protein